MGAVNNRLLDGLPRRDREHLFERCEPVEIKLGQVLCEPERPVRYVYFPTSSFISLIAPINGKASLEVGIVGSEGMLGTSLVLGVHVSPQRALVQGAGSALRIKAAPFCRELERSLPLRRGGLNRYLYVTLCQVALTAVCALPCGGGAACALAADDRRSGALRPVLHHAGIHVLHAGGASRGGDRSRRRAARAQTDSLSTRPNHHSRSPRPQSGRMHLLRRGNRRLQPYPWLRQTSALLTM